MFGYSGNCGCDPESCGFDRIFQFHKSVFIGPVAIDTDKDSLCLVSFDQGKTFTAVSGTRPP